MIEGTVLLSNFITHLDEHIYELRDAFFDSGEYFGSGGDGPMQNIIMGSIIQDSQNMDRFAVEDVTNFLFANIDNIGSVYMAWLTTYDL